MRLSQGRTRRSLRYALAASTAWGGLLGVGVGAVGGTVAGSGAIAGAVMLKSGFTPTWSNYFYPLTVGWTCHESLHSGGATGTETLRIDAVQPVRGGKSVTVVEGSSTTVNGTSIPTNASLHYVLTDAGQLISVPSAGQTAGQSFQIQGDTTYPSVRALLGGGAAVSKLHISAPLNQSDLAQLKVVLQPGASSLSMLVELRQSGSPVAVLTTPMGTFHHVLAVHSSLKSIQVTDALKAAENQLDSTLQPVIAKELAITTWYAPGVGPVKFKVGSISSAMTSCGAS
jgi:hypothetical protein